MLNRWSFENLLEFYRFDEAELVQMLARLDRLRMVELLPNNRIKLLLAPNFGWLPNGPIEKVFLQAIQRDFFATRFDREGFLETPELGSDHTSPAPCSATTTSTSPS